MARKSLDFDDATSTIVADKLKGGRFGNSENKVVNALIQTIPKQEAEIQRQITSVNSEREQKDHWSKRALAAEKELQQVKNALAFVGQLLQPPPE